MLSREQIETFMREGAEAFERGMSKGNCPYPVLSTPFATWMRGYQNAAYGAAQLEKHHV
jgi:ribosome modulation factor